MADRAESEQERLDRQLDQLLQELRVAMPGVQVLFAFLLAVPFQQRFAQATEFQIIRRAGVCAVAGLLALGVAMTGAVVLVTDVILDSGTTVVTGLAVGLLLAWLWFAMGLIRRARERGGRR